MKLQIVQWDGTVLYDLLAGVIKIDRKTWGTQMAHLNGEYTHRTYGATFAGQYYDLLEEVFDIEATSGTNNNLTLQSELTTLENALQAALRWQIDPKEYFSVWLLWANDGESDKMALIYNYSIAQPGGVGVGPLLRNGVLKAQLTITRHPLWETPYASNYKPAAVGLSCSGGKYASTTFVGSEPSRIWVGQFYGASGGGTIQRLWCGIRKTYFGSSSFNPVIEVENGSNEADTVTYSDGGLSVKKFPFANTALIKRTRILLGDVVGSNYTHYVGQYHVLARLRSSAGSSSFGVQLKYGFYGFNGTGVFEPNEEVFFDTATYGSTNYRILDLGLVDCPPMRYPMGGFLDNDALKYFGFDIFSERITGSGFLYVDKLYLVPSYSFAYADNAAIYYEPVFGTTSPLYFLTLEDDSVQTQAYGPNSWVAVNATPQMDNFFWPVGGGVMVIVGERSDQHVLTDAVNMELQCVPRWKMYRTS